MEEELTDILVELLKNKISEILKLLLSKEELDILKELILVFDVRDVKNHIVAFFESFQVTDFSKIEKLPRFLPFLHQPRIKRHDCKESKQDDSDEIYPNPKRVIGQTSSEPESTYQEKQLDNGINHGFK